MIKCKHIKCCEAKEGEIMRIMMAMRLQKQTKKQHKKFFGGLWAFAFALLK